MGFKRNSRMRRRLSRKRPRSTFSSWRSSNLAPLLSIGGIVLSLAAFACIIIFLIIPIFSGKMNKPIAPKPTSSLRPFHDPNEIIDLSKLENEAMPKQKSINGPFILGTQMVYSAGQESIMNPPLKNISIYNLDSNETDAPIAAIACKYNNLFEPKMNENWIVCLDVNSKAGGRILGYDRKNDKMFVIREYLYGMPKVRLAGDYIAWMQQTATSTDKLYMCYLPTNETVCIKTFTDTPYSISAVGFSDSELIWVEKSGENEAGESSCVIKRMAFSGGKASEPTDFDTGTYVFDPLTDGKNIVFMDGNRNEDAHLMISVNGGKPKAIDAGVVNYELGDGFVAYTKKDESIYVYFINTGYKGKLTGKNSRGDLATVNGDMVCWYDTTDGGLVRDVIKYAKVTAANYY
jgi:hypothetical protein